MNKNCIEGRYDGMSWHNTAKSFCSIMEVNAVVVSRSNALLPGEVPQRLLCGKSAETIVVSHKPGVL